VNLLLLAIGVVMLTVGGEALIRGSLAAANRLRVSPLLSGLVIVGFGTSMPELMVSVSAALNQQPDIAVGNVVGSNIGNIFLILGICALISPMAVNPLALRRDAVAGIAASVLFVVLVRGSALGRPDAVIFLVSLFLRVFSEKTRGPCFLLPSTIHIINKQLQTQVNTMQQYFLDALQTNPN